MKYVYYIRSFMANDRIGAKAYSSEELAHALTRVLFPLSIQKINKKLFCLI